MVAVRCCTQWHDEEGEDDEVKDDLGQVVEDDGEDVEDTDIKGQNRVWIYNG